MQSSPVQQATPNFCSHTNAEDIWSKRLLWYGQRMVVTCGNSNVAVGDLATFFTEIKKNVLHSKFSIKALRVTDAKRHEFSTKIFSTKNTKSHFKNAVMHFRTHF